MLDMEAASRESPITPDPETSTQVRGWRVWLTLLGLTLSLQLVWTVIMLALWQWHGSAFDLTAGATMAWQWAGLLTNCGLVLLIFRWLHTSRTPPTALGIDFIKPAIEIFIGLASGAIIWAVASGPLWLFRLKEIHPLDVARSTLTQPAELLLLIIAALCEEIVWRGFAIHRVHERLRLSAAVIVVALAYAVYHVGLVLEQGPVMLPWTAFIGFSLSALYLWRRKLLPAIVAHFVIGLLG